jgi:peptide/nickel transport system permease protein
MLNYIIRRLISAVVVLLIIAAISFVIIQLPPGDFGSYYKQQLVSLGGMTEGEAEVAADKLRERYGLNDPVPIQFVNWIGGIVTRGEFGFSLSYSRDVGELIAERLPRTFFLALASHAISSLVGIAIGIYIANRQYSVADNLAAAFAFIATSVPRFSLALIIIYWLAFGLGQQHVQSLFSPEYVIAPWSLGKFVDLLKHVWPVIFIAGFGGVARNMRVMRGNLLDVLNAQYVTTARSKGLRERTVINKHAVPNALHPILAYQGAVLPYMFNGELEASIVLGIPTLGPLFLQSLNNQDIYISGTMLVLYGALLVIGNLIADLSLGILDPRIRYN